jgi:hypothetical protein
LTDVEGRWDKLVDFCAAQDAVRLEGDRLVVAPDALFVFGGDAIDRGPASRRIVSTLLAAKEAQPDRVVLLAGNRDINKMRLVRELGGHPPSRAPIEIVREGPVALLRFIFSQTMGAREAFEQRRAELLLEGRSSSDEDVVESWLADLAPDGPLTRYLASLCLAHREGDTLFVHGAVTAESFLAIPGEPRAADVDAWVARLGAFYADQVGSFVARELDPAGRPRWSALVDYQAPIRGTRLNQASVVYGRPSDELGRASLPPEAVVAALRAEGVRRVVVGHTPAGDCPAVLRDGRGFELVLADTSYGRIETGAAVIVDGEGLEIRGVTVLDGGERAPVLTRVGEATRSPLGLRDAGSGALVKAGLERGGYLAFRALGGYDVEQRAVSEEELRQARLEVPR